jgi:hypothetical protein
MALSKNNFQVKWQSDGDGHWELVNEKGDGLKTSDDDDDTEWKLQMIAGMLNNISDKVWVQTALELTLHCNEQMAKMECDYWKQQANDLLTTLESIKEDCKSKGTPMDLVLQSIYNKAEKAIKEYNK